MKYLKYYVNKNVHIIGIFEQFISVYVKYVEYAILLLHALTIKIRPL